MAERPRTKENTKKTVSLEAITATLDHLSIYPAVRQHFHLLGNLTTVLKNLHHKYCAGLGESKWQILVQEEGRKEIVVLWRL